MDNTDSIIIKAIKSALTDTGEISVTDEEADKAIRKAERHGVGALVCYGLEKGGCPSEHTFSVMMDELRRHVLFDEERIRIEGLLAENGVDYMLLKGTIVQDWYPESYLRHMADTDILIREKDRGKVKSIFENEGYSVFMYDRTQHDIYRKDPVYNYEIHINLFHESTGYSWYRYYSDVWSVLEPDADHPHRYRFKDADMYAYLITHSLGHLMSSGTGIRTLADIYLTDERYGLINDDRVKNILSVLGIYEDALLISGAVHKLFDGDISSLTDNEKAFIDNVFSSALYGTTEERIENKVTERGNRRVTVFSKFKYIVGRMFLPMYSMKALFPVLKKCPWLYPVMALWRLIRQPFRDMGKVTRELKILKKVK